MKTKKKYQGGGDVGQPLRPSNFEKRQAKKVGRAQTRATVANIECEQNIEVVAKFEKSPYIRIEGNQITLPIYGEELSEIIKANWGFIKNRFPQRWYS